jgi:DNA-binding winged helix-turn-helix (wHTH) protein
VTRYPQIIYESGPYHVDGAKRLLLRDGEVVPLTPKCFEILLALVEKSREILDKEGLMNRVWPDSFVEEGNLTYNISVLRKALGEKANEHLYIVTVPGRGYQFVASVSEVCLDGTEQSVRALSDSGGALARPEPDEIEADSRNAAALSPVTKDAHTSHPRPVVASRMPAIRRYKSLFGAVVIVVVALIG